MPTPKPFDQTIHLSDRRLIRIAGPDAQSFLQNIMTNDVAQDGLIYSCLLTPQGQVLHDFFVVKQGEGDYLLDVDSGRADDLLRRLAVFKLRAKVSITDEAAIKVYAAPQGLNDPRLAAVGGRLYTQDMIAKTATLSDYEDHLIRLGIPGAKAMRYEKDIAADLNLDLLNAIGWDKGCFIGQEVTARMKYRGLAKKRLMIVTGENLAPGETAYGDIRQVNQAKTAGLAVVKLAQAASFSSIKTPDYLLSATS